MAVDRPPIFKIHQALRPFDPVPSDRLRRSDAPGGRLQGFARYVAMDETIDALRLRMEAAAEALDFEEARCLRDRINLLRGGTAPAEAASADTSGLDRQRPGAMGLGSSRSQVEPPPGWRPPAKPDPMTRRRGRRQRP